MHLQDLVDEASAPSGGTGFRQGKPRARRWHFLNDSGQA